MTIFILLVLNFNNYISGLIYRVLWMVDLTSLTVRSVLLDSARTASNLMLMFTADISMVDMLPVT